MPLNVKAFASCANLSQQALAAIESGRASYAELDSQLTLEDAINIIELDQVINHNQSLMEELRREFSNRR